MSLRQITRSAGSERRRSAPLYLLNGSFETDGNADGIADSWLEEHSTASAATYTLVASAVADGGSRAQRMVHAADGTSDGTKKVEFYQATSIGAFTPGDAATFEVWLSGSVTAGYVTIVVEAHTGGTYLAEVNQIVSLTSVPQPFRITYPALPAGTDSVVVVVQAPEVGATTAVDITADAATLVKASKAALTHRTNFIPNPSFEAGTTLATGWTDANSVGGTVTYSLSTTTPSFGAKKQRVQYTSINDTNKLIQLISAASTNGTVAPGDSVTISIYLDGTATAGISVALRLQFMTSAGGSAGTSDGTAVTLTGTPARASYTATAPATTSAVRALVRITSISTGRLLDINLDGALLEKAASAGVYFDGSTAGYQWMGPSNASASSDLITYPAP